MIIHFLSQNSFKINTAQMAMKPYGIEVVPIELNIPEIQAETNLEIAVHGTKKAVKKINQPIMREDHGFYLNAFSGWPGPYMSYTEPLIPAKDLLKLIAGKNRTGYFKMALAYAEPGNEILKFSFQVPVTIAEKLMPGDKDFGWDSIICLKDDSRTLSEYPQQDRYSLFSQNFINLAKQLNPA